MGRVQFEQDGAIGIIRNCNPEKHNAFDDSMDGELFDILASLRDHKEIRAVVWTAEGASFSSGRDVSAFGTIADADEHRALMRRGHRGIQQLWDLDIPIIVCHKGWSMGGSFQRAMLCDIRIASEDARFRLPELTHGVIPDTGGVAVLYELCGHGLVNDMVLSGRTLTATEALAHGIVSRVVPLDELESTARTIADQIAKVPPVTLRVYRQMVRNLAVPTIRASMNDELIGQTYLRFTAGGPHD